MNGIGETTGRQGLRLPRLASALFIGVVLGVVMSEKAAAQVVLDMPPIPAPPQAALLPAGEAIVDDELSMENAEAIDEASRAAAEAYRRHHLATGRLALQRYTRARTLARWNWPPQWGHAVAYADSFRIFGNMPRDLAPGGWHTPFWPGPPAGFWPWHWHWHWPWFWHSHPHVGFVGGGVFMPSIVILPPQPTIRIKFSVGGGS